MTTKINSKLRQEKAAPYPRYRTAFTAATLFKFKVIAFRLLITRHKFVMEVIIYHRVFGSGGNLGLSQFYHKGYISR
ncbi:MAG TPA: hypothetical protein DCS48_15230 [Desulfovibrio sp.]|nr:hypothetical protein [Desulfovibrio sp.]